MEYNNMRQQDLLVLLIGAKFDLRENIFGESFFLEKVDEWGRDRNPYVRNSFKRHFM
jgi:hypothetical protein